MTNCLSSLDMRPLKPLVYIPIIPIFKKNLIVIYQFVYYFFL